MAVRALVFDFDGLITDTEWPEYRSVAEQFELHGLSYPPERWVHVIGSSWDVDWIGELEREIGRSVDRALLERRRRERGRALREGLVPLPGVVELIRAAAEVGWSLAVASSSPRRWVEPMLAELGLAAHFPVVRTLDDVERAKPAPDLFLAACDGLGVAPSEAVALEDSANGTTAAKAAGLWCVAVPNRLTRYLDLSHADLVVESLQHLEPAHLVELAASPLHAEGVAPGPRPLGHLGGPGLLGHLDHLDEPGASAHRGRSGRWD